MLVSSSVAFLVKLVATTRLPSEYAISVPSRSLSCCACCAVCAYATTTAPMITTPSGSVAGTGASGSITGATPIFIIRFWSPQMSLMITRLPSTTLSAGMIVSPAFSPSFFHCFGTTLGTSFIAIRLPWASTSAIMSGRRSPSLSFEVKRVKPSRAWLSRSDVLLVLSAVTNE